MGGGAVISIFDGKREGGFLISRLKVSNRKQDWNAQNPLLAMGLLPEHDGLYRVLPPFLPSLSS